MKIIKKMNYNRYIFDVKNEFDLIKFIDFLDETGTSYYVDEEERINIIDIDVYKTLGKNINKINRFLRKLKSNIVWRNEGINEEMKIKEIPPFHLIGFLIYNKEVYMDLDYFVNYLYYDDSIQKHSNSIYPTKDIKFGIKCSLNPNIVELVSLVRGYYSGVFRENTSMESVIKFFLGIRNE